MREIYLNWFKQAEEALRIVREIDLPKYPKPRCIVFAGMGGSGIIGDYVKVLGNYQLNIPVVVVKDYKLPSWASGEDLLVCISYSGNTGETIKCFNEALMRKMNILAFSSNGTLEKLASEKNVAFIPLVKGLVPRASLPAMLYSVLGSLNKVSIEIVSEENIKDSIDILRRPVDWSKVDSIVESIEGKMPIIISYTDYYPLALRFKNELNENSKIPVKVEVVPEWGHNDIVGWEMPYSREYTAIILRSRKGGDEVSNHMLDYAAEYYKSIGLRVEVLECIGENLLSQLVYGSLIAGLVSIVLAEKRGIDPIRTISIERYKKAISNVL